jgi:hypothetical protein
MTGIRLQVSFALWSRAVPQNNARIPSEKAAVSMPRHPRDEIADSVALFEQRRAEGMSQREFARVMGVPRTSLQHWLGRKSTIDADPAVVAFFESPVGVAFLHRLVVSLHVVFSFIGSSGSRLIGRFLREAGLGPFVATSVGSQTKVAAQVERAIGEYGDDQKAVLSAAMPPKVITACQDETFHPKPCLVAIEPVSNFILLERYDTKRDAATWDAHMREALQGLKVDVVQSTSDEAKGILAHVRDGLGAHHSPDVFHVQHALGGALARPLAQAVRGAEQELEAAKGVQADVSAWQTEWETQPRGPGRPPDFEGRRRKARADVDEAQKKLDAALKWQEQGRQAIRGIGEAYHPIDIASGKPRSLQQIKDVLDGHIERAYALVRDGAVPERAKAGINKAARVLPAMMATLTFFFSCAADALEALPLDLMSRQVARDVLLPATYLDVAAKKAKTADERHRMASLAATLKQQAYADAPALRAALVTQVMLVCSQMFQRASSCVEGRNGHLSMRHHCLHVISDTRLKALTTVHNYGIEDADQTTAAERFFGIKPTRALIEYICDRVELPARPAAKRSRQKGAKMAA